MKSNTKQEKRERRLKIIVSTVIAFLMITSVIGFLYSGGTDDRYNYNGHQFKKSGYGWSTKIDTTWANFAYYPPELESINVSAPVVPSLKDAKVVYLTFDPTSSFIGEVDQVRFDLSTKFPQWLGIFVIDATTRDDDRYTLPIVTCMNATADAPVLYLTEGNATAISQQGSCILFQASKTSDLLKLEERLLYGLLGIMS
ncbi:hypothetical protein HYW21_04255 [Candidatus Woesearchaeota archaeon]|nr:hypothetical protein [Candidatus Woesearchaeota archaeon]